MNFEIPLIVVIVVILLVSLFIRSKNDSYSDDLTALPKYVSGLLSATVPNAFLIVTLPESGDFLQFVGWEQTVQIEMPLKTERQNELEGRFRSSIAGLGLQVTETREADGSRFLNVQVKGDADYISQVIIQLFTEVFGAEPGCSVEYSWDGYDPISA